MDSLDKIYEKCTKISKNCWLMKFLPGGAGNANAICFEEKCLQNQLAAIGWGHELSEEWKCKYNDSEISAPLIESYVNNECGNTETETETWKMKLSKALRQMQDIQVGDYVLTRSKKDSRYYVGKVNKRAYLTELFEDGKANWACEVEEWKSIEEWNAPSEVVGRFSQRRQATIKRVASPEPRIRFLKYCRLILNEKNENNESEKKININQANFARCLRYEELEDLIGFYIMNKTKYHMIPSTCRNSTKSYEFYLTNDEGKIIALQVKNQTEISDIEFYRDAKNKSVNLEKQYLFSGVWSDNKVEELNNTYSSEGLEFIKPSDVWTFLMECSYFKNLLNKYYSIEVNISSDGVQNQLGDLKQYMLETGMEPKRKGQKYGKYRRYWLGRYTDEEPDDESDENEVEKRVTGDSPSIERTDLTNIRAIWLKNDFVFFTDLNDFVKFV